MKPCSIASVISFCSHDWRFLEACIAGIKANSSQIIVTTCDHLFNGEKENYALLENAYLQFPNVLFLEFAYDPQKTYHYTNTLPASHPYIRRVWHNTGRWISFYFLQETIDYIHFCDADEVIDPSSFSSWLEKENLCSFSCVRFASSFYFREAQYQAISDTMNGTLLVQKKELQPSMLWNLKERMGIFNSLPGEKLLRVTDSEGNPFVHHYSWVKTKEELLKKTSSWAHYWEKNWQDLLEEEYARPFNGKDFIYKHRYKTVKPFFDPLSLKLPTSATLSLEDHLSFVKQLDNVIRIDQSAMFTQEIKKNFLENRTL